MLFDIPTDRLQLAIHKEINMLAPPMGYRRVMDRDRAAEMRAHFQFEIVNYFTH
jgi:hypothetical protein